MSGALFLVFPKHLVVRVYPNTRAPPNIRASPPSWSREIIIASGISPVIGHDNTNFLCFSRYIQCFIMVIDSNH